MSHAPADLRYTETHEWIRPGGDACAVGITAHAVASLTDITYLDLPDVGKVLNAGDAFGEVESVKAVAALNSPVSGTITEVNRPLANQLELLAQDPYGKGWLLMVKPRNAKSDLKNLLSGRLVSAWMEETVNSLRVRMGENLGLVYQDGGVPVTGIAKALSPDKWDEVAKEYLLSS